MGNSVGEIILTDPSRTQLIGNGILTCMNISQAQVRSDPLGKKRKGKEAAKAVLSILGFKI